MFDGYKCVDDYLEDGVIPIEPMTAKEIMDKDIDTVLHSSGYIVEEKIDGVRANVQFFGSYCRVFSRRKSVVTGFYGEKSDNLPQIRDIAIPELAGTILDGELVVPKKDFKTTSAILNCLPVEAVERQMSEGQVVFNVFDCLYFKGKDIMHLPLQARKTYLAEVMGILSVRQGTSCIREVFYYVPPKDDCLKVYRDIVNRGGEGIMIKDLNAPYEMKRTRAYQKLKKKLTRDVVILGFNEPTEEYTGKFPNNKWDYWKDNLGNFFFNYSGESATKMLKRGNVPVTRHYFNKMVGAIVYGVKASKEMLALINEGKYNALYGKYTLKLNGKTFDLRTKDFEYYVVVGECEGMTDSEREEFTRNKSEYVGKVIEVECNEVFKDTGKMRHPRFICVREDKGAEECTWEAHINDN